MRYSFVLFDAGETLFGPRESFGATYARVLSPMGLDLPPAVFEEALRESWEEMNHVVPRGQDRYGHFPGGEMGYWLRFARHAIERAVGGPLPPGFPEAALRRLRKAFLGPDAWTIYPDVVPTLTTLRAEGVPLGIVSNWDSRLPAILRMLGLFQFFDAVTVSHLEGVEKPEPALFQKALARLNAGPQETLHVGDIPELDLAGARAAGMDGVLVDRRGRLDPSLGALPDLLQIPRIVREGVEPVTA